MSSIQRIIFIVFLNILVATIVILTAHSKKFSPSSISGSEIWKQKNCGACHSLFGLGGHIGPDLTNVYTRKGKEYISYILKNGFQNMPNFHLSQMERNELIAYLKEMNDQGKYPLKEGSKESFGVYEK